MRAGRLDVPTARGTGRVGCRRCTAVWASGTERCGRCGRRLEGRDPLALQKVWAWWVAGVICYVPANLYPMLSTRLLFDVKEATILEGVVEFVGQGSYGVAFIIFFASVCIPIAKFVAIAWLASEARQRRAASALGLHRRLQLYEVVEFIGRWSMIDIFVVAITAALVRIGALASVEPGPAALAFAGSVVFTMLSARAFDPRLIWDPVSEASPGIATHPKARPA